MARTPNRYSLPAPGRCWRWLLAALLVPALVACGARQSGEPASVAPTTAARPASASARKAIKVVTTMSVLSDMVKNVGGERVEVQNMIPIGAGPEDFQPTPQDAQIIGAADVVFYNGHALEGWLPDLFKNAAKPGQPQIAVSEGLDAVDVGSEEFAEGNPHFWLSAAYGARYVEKIRDGLLQVDPAGKETYTSNAAAYIKQLTDLNAELKQQAGGLPESARKIVTNHDAFPYFAREYGFTIVGNVLGSPESEPAAGELAQLVERIKAEQVRAIFSESQFSPNLTKTIADEAGIKLISNLYTDSLGDAGSGVTSYVELLRYDMKTVVDALK